MWKEEMSGARRRWCTSFSADNFFKVIYLDM